MPIIGDNDIISQKALEAPGKLGAELDRVYDSLVKILNAAKQSEGIIVAAKSVNKVSNETQKLSLAQVELNKIQKQLATAHARTNSEYEIQQKKLIAIKEAQRQKNKETKNEILLSGAVGNEYRKLTIQLERARDKYRNLAASGVASNKILKSQEKVVQDLSSKVNAIDKTVGVFNRNVGNYSSAIVGSLKNIFAAFGLIGGVRLAVDFLRDARQLADEAKGVEFAFKRLGDAGEDAFERVKKSTRGLLSDLDIKKSLVNFDNFNISLEESATLFEFLSVRAAQTGNSIEYLRDSLVEGLSKESKLRIDNLGISAAKLNSELEKTPNFVQAVANIAREEIKEAGNILDDAASSQLKFNAAMENFKLAVGSGFISTITNAFYDMGAAVLSLIAPIKTLSQQLKTEQTRLNVLVGAITEVNISEEARLALIRKLQTEYPEFLKNIDAEKVSNKELLTQLELVNSEYEKKIVLAVAEKRLNDIREKIANTIEREAEARERLAQLKEGEQKGPGFSGLGSTLDLIRVQEGSIAQQQKERAGLQDILTKRLQAYTDALKLNESVIKSSTEKGSGSSRTIEEINKEIEALFKLQEFRLQTEINNAKSVEDRVAKEIELEDLRLGHLLAGEKLLSDEKTLIREKYIQNVKDIEAKGDEDLLKERIERERKAIEEVIKVKQEQLDKEIQAIKQAAIDRGETSEEIEDQITEARKKAGVEMIEFTIQQLEKELLIKGLSIEDEKKIYDEIAKFRIALTDELYDNLNQKQEENADKVIEALTKAQKVYEEYGGAILQIFSNISAARIMRLDEESAKIQANLARELELAGDNEVAKDALRQKAAQKEAVLEKKRRAEQRKAAIREKAFGIVSVGIQTAINVAEAFPVVPLMAAAAALGALQIASIASKPIPAFKAGTSFAPGGAALVSEEGSEMMVSPKGEISLTPHTPTVMNVPRGTEIIPHKETMKLLALSGMSQKGGEQKTDQALINEVKRLNENIKNIKPSNSNLVRNGSTLYRAIEDKKGHTKLVRDINLGKWF